MPPAPCQAGQRGRSHQGSSGGGGGGGALRILVNIGSLIISVEILNLCEAGRGMDWHAGSCLPG